MGTDGQENGSAHAAHYAKMRVNQSLTTMHYSAGPCKDKPDQIHRIGQSLVRAVARAGMRDATRYGASWMIRV